MHRPSDSSLEPVAADIDRAAFLRRVGLSGIAVSSTASLLAACGGGGTDSAATAESTSAAPATGGGDAVTPAIAAKFKGKTIGVPVYTLLDDNEVSIVKWLKQASKDAGLDWNFIVDDTRADQAAAQTTVQSYVTRKVDAIIDITVPASFIAAQLAAAKSANIPVVGTFTFAPFDETLAVDYSAPLDHDAILMAHYLIGDQQTQRKHMKVKVGMLDAALDVIKPRRAAFLAVAKPDPNVEIVAQDFGISATDTVVDATRRAKAMLRRNPEINALWCNYPPIAVPVASAVAQSGKTDVQVYGHIANSAGVEALRDEGNPLVATTWVDWPFQAYGLVDVLLQVLAGKQPDRLTSWKQPVPDTIFDGSNVESEVPKGQKAADWMFAGGTYRTGFLKRWNTLYAA